MNTNMKNLVAKLKLFGNKVIILDDCRLISINPWTKEAVLVIAGVGKNDISDKYDNIEPIDDTYCIATKGNEWELLNGTKPIRVYKGYGEVGRGIKTAKGIINLIVKLKRGNYYGVITSDECGVIPIMHNSLEVYNTNKGWIYVGGVFDNKRVYEETGKEHPINKVINTANVIVAKDRLIVVGFKGNSSPPIRVEVYDLNGERICNDNIKDISGDYVDSDSILLINRDGTKEKVYKAPKK